MFSSSKILFANHRALPPVTTTTPSPVPLSITAQPQNVTLRAGSISKIGQTTWATGLGYKRTMVRWERSVNGIDWFPEDSAQLIYEQNGEFLVIAADLAQSGLKYRTYAYAYEQYTYLPNYMMPDGPRESAYMPPEGSYGKIDISAGGMRADHSFIFVKGGQFLLSLFFSGEGRVAGDRSLAEVSFVNVNASIGNRSVASIENLDESYYVQNIDFTASPGELMRFNLETAFYTGLMPDYGFSITTSNALHNVPYVGSKVFSDPFTLTVIP